MVKYLHLEKKDFDQTMPMSRLVCVFIECILRGMYPHVHPGKPDIGISEVARFRR